MLGSHLVTEFNVPSWGAPLGSFDFMCERSTYLVTQAAPLSRGTQGLLEIARMRDRHAESNEHAQLAGGTEEEDVSLGVNASL